MKGTLDEVKFGDMIQLDYTVDMNNGKTKHKHLEVKFMPQLVEYLAEEGIIEVKEDEETPVQGILDFDMEGQEDRREDYDEDDGFYDCLLEAMDCVAKSLSGIKDQLAEIRMALSSLLPKAKANVGK